MDDKNNKSPIHETIAYVSLFRNVKQKVDKKTKKPVFDANGKPVMEVSWNATFKAGTVDVSSQVIPAFSWDMFEKRISASGKTTYFRSRNLLVVRYTDVRSGNVPGKYFTNLVALEEQPTMSLAALEAKYHGGDAPEPTPKADELPNDAEDDDENAEEVPEF